MTAKRQGQPARTITAQRVLLTIQGGGFFWQSCSVARALENEFEVEYISSCDEKYFPDKNLPTAPWHTVTPITTLTDHTIWRKAWNVFRGLLDSLVVIRKVNPDAIVCVATSLAVPLCICGRLMGKKTVFIESITRVSTPSVTGKILSRLHLCNRHYVQWPEAESLYPAAIYRGSVL